MLSNSHFFSEIAHSAFLVPEQSMLKSGWPRNDIFFDFCKIKENNLKVRKYFDCSQDEFIVLYAPTFRDDQIDRGYIDVESDVISALMEKFHKKVKVLLRGHHLIKNKTFSYHGDEIMADASDYEDMLPLLNQPIYKEIFGDIEKDYPVSHWINNNGFYVGCHHGLSKEELNMIIKTIHAFLENRIKDK